MQYLDCEFDALKNLINGKPVIYYLVGKKGCFLDPIEASWQNNNFLDKLLKGENWAPQKANTEKWKIKKKISRLEVWEKLQKFTLPEKKHLGLNENKLPSL